MDYNPKHDKVFKCKFNTWDEMRAAVFDVQCWDDDKGRSDEKVATVSIPFPQVPILLIFFFIFFFYYFISIIVFDVQCWDYDKGRSDL